MLGPTPETSSLKKISKLLYTSNPFYVIGSLLLIASSNSMASQLDFYGSECFFPAFITFFILILSVISYVLIVHAKVWDDARTLFFLICMLFFALSISVDELLVSSYDRYRSFPFIAYLYSLLICEFLIKSCKLNFNKFFRMCLYCVLFIVFIYPLVLTRLIGETFFIRGCGIAVFALVIPLPFLLLHNNLKQFMKNNSPYTWPLYPFSFFIFLMVCCVGRLYYMSISLGPGSVKEVVFAPWFLVPVILMISFLLGTYTRTLKNIFLESITKVTPAMCLLISMNTLNDSPCQMRFYDAFTENFCSPLYFAVILCTLYLMVEMWMNKALNPLCALLFLALFISPQTVSIKTIEGLQLFPLIGLNLLYLYQLIRFKNSMHYMVLSCLAYVCVFELLGFEWDAKLVVIALHYLYVSFLISSVLYKDVLSYFLRRMNRKMAMAVTLIALLMFHLNGIELDRNTITLYCFSHFTALLIYSYLIHCKHTFFAALSVLMMTLISLFVSMFSFYKDYKFIKIIMSIAAGCFFFMLALFISFKKAGWIKINALTFKRLMPHVN